MTNSVEIFTGYSRSTEGNTAPGELIHNPSPENHSSRVDVTMFRDTASQQRQTVGKYIQPGSDLVKKPKRQRTAPEVTPVPASGSHGNDASLCLAKNEAALQDSLDLFSLFTHQLLTYMTYIELTVDTLLFSQSQSGPQQADTQEEDLQFIRHQVEHSADVLKRGLNLVRLLREGSVQLEPIALFPLIQSVVRRFKAQYGNREISFTLAHDSVVWGSRLLIELVLENLLQNALSHSGADSSVAITLDEHGGQIMVRVMDNGCGIPEEQLQKLFTPLGQFKPTNTTSSAHGLGLFLTKMAVEMQGGHIAVESQPSRGTEFCLTLKKCAA